MSKKLNGALFFVDVIPLVPIPGGRRDSYSYLAEMPVPFGSLVSIPFGPRTIRGIAIRCEPIPSAPKATAYKRIASIVEPSFLTEQQLLLARHISEHCFTSLGKTLKHFLLPRVKERTAASKGPDTKKKYAKTNKERACIKTIQVSAENIFFAREGAATMLRVAIGLRKQTRSKEQILILFPEQLALPDAKALLAEWIDEKKLAVIHSKLSGGALFSAWERIRSGEADIILGTRQALFAPFKRLSAVFVLEESERVGYKQWDMSPRYDARTEAVALAEFHGANTVFASEAPSLEILHRVEKQTCVLLPEINPQAKRTITFVDMRQERYQKNFSIFSETLSADIRWVRQQGKQTLLIGSRNGIDSFSTCTECKTVPRCKICDRALRSTREGNFKCPTCAYQTKSFPRCEKCGSLSFRNVGSGTEKIEREARKRFPESTIVRIDGKDLSGASFEKNVLAAKDADILIGTPSILQLPALPKAGFVAMMDADNFLSFPDFRADEKLLGIFLKSLSVAGRGWPHGKLLVQTFNPEKKPFSAIRDNGIEAVRESLMSDRKSLGYPPFATAWKLTAQDSSRENALREADERQKKYSALTKKTAGLKISAVTVPVLEKVRGKYRQQFLIRLPEGAPLPADLRQEIKKLPFSWIIEPDPLSLN